MRRIYNSKSANEPLLITDRVVPGWGYVWDENPYDFNSDIDLMRWFRGIPEGNVTVGDLVASQDKRYAQPLLYFLARTAHARTIVEIGIADGSTTWPLLKAASESQGMVYSIDPSWCTEAKDLASRCGWDQYWRFFNGKSDDFFAGEGKNLAIEFAFIDGDHSYQGVYNDAKNIIERLIPGGIVVLDEWSIHWSQEKDDVQLRDGSNESAAGGTNRALCDLLPLYPEMDIWPLYWGVCGYDRFKEWTESTMVMLRKRTNGECQPYRR